MEKTCGSEGDRRNGTQRKDKMMWVRIVLTEERKIKRREKTKRRFRTRLEECLRTGGSMTKDYGEDDARGKDEKEMGRTRR